MKPRAKIIPDKLFFKLWKAANEGYDKHNYISNFTSSTSVDFVDFKNKYGIYYEEATEMLSNIYEAVKSHTTEVACFHTCFSGGMDSLTEDTVITPQLHAV